ncbi:LuxR C-terminal-related transcriptional regulator [Streptomyces sp. NPDC000987]|uniref:helix-turn-helix transcriptional regulator n=1 Tax=Streptomyces sp. NPDC000987 TaxID=3154374 RepID=UPI00332255CB
MNAQPSASRWPMVGRDGELALFTRAWADRSCQGVVVCGPAGVGKTRLAEECSAHAVASGSKALRATASAAAATVPLGAIAHLLPADVDLSDPVRGFDQVAAALAAPRGHRWAVFIDDLHLLDATSAVLLRQLLDARVIRLIGTVRTGEPASDAVAALTGPDAVWRMDLGELSEEQTDQLLRQVLGGPTGHRTLKHLHTVSQGNVLYLRELVTGALRAGTLTRRGMVWELTMDLLTSTPKLTELIKARLLAGGPAALPILELLALCEPLPLADAQATASLDVLTDLEGAGLIRVTTSRRRTTVQLAHPLYGEVLRAGIPSLRRRTLLQHQSERTLAHGARRRDDALHLATWQLTATGTAEPGLLSQAAALARHAHDYRQVVTLLEALPETHRTTATRLLLGEAHSSLHQFEEAETVLARACEAAENEAERIVTVRARALTLLLHGRTSEALSVNDWGKDHMGSTIGKRAIQANEGYIRCLTGEPVLGLSLLDAMADLEAAIDSEHILDVWLVSALCKSLALAFTGRAAAASEFAAKAYATHLRMDQKALFQHPSAQLHGLTVALTEAGELERARTTGRDAIAQAVAAGSPANYLWASFFTCRSEFIAGHLNEARDLCAEAASEAHSQNVAFATRLMDSVLAATHAQTGDVETAEAIVAESLDHPMSGLFRGEERLGEAWLHAARGDLAAARAVLTEAASSARRGGHVTSEALLLTDVARLGGAGEVADRLAELAATCDGALAQARAHLAAALAADDPDRLFAAAEDLEALGADLLAAEAATAAATAWLRTGETRRAANATTRATVCARRCPGARTPLLAGAEATAPLTTREREIALLAAGGASSNDIAAALHLSARTVNNHLQSAYRKLGVTSRRDLADILHRTAGDLHAPSNEAAR